MSGNTYVERCWKGAFMSEQRSQEGDVDVTLFVPCYNEEGNIGGTLETIRNAMAANKRTYEVIVIDDASRDHSRAIIEAFQERHADFPLRVVINPVNRGLSANYRTAAETGRGRFIRIICGDNVEPVTTQIDILEKLGQADMVIPYPIHVENKTLSRRILSRIYCLIMNTLSGYWLPYWNGCGLMRRADVVKYFPPTRGFGFQADLTSQLLSLGRTYVCVGCYYTERASGQSKACTFKNFRSVSHVAVRILGRRFAGWLHWAGGLFRGKPVDRQPATGRTMGAARTGANGAASSANVMAASCCNALNHEGARVQ